MAEELGMEREGTTQHLWGTFEVYVMAENDLALASLSYSLFSGKDGVEESQFRGNANCSERERLLGQSSLPKVLFDT